MVFNFTLAIFRAISFSELLFRQRNGAKYNESEIKNDNFTVKLSFLFNSENSVVLRYTRNIVQLKSDNITHPCNSMYIGKIFLYIDHSHIEYLYNITFYPHVLILQCNQCFFLL